MRTQKVIAKGSDDMKAKQEINSTKFDQAMFDQTVSEAGSSTETESAIRIASHAAILYLLNILILPIFAFILLLLLYVRHQQHPSILVRNHLQQAMRASLCAGFMLLFMSALILLYGDLRHVGTWMALILYVLCVHSVFILYGVLAFTHALAGKTFRYPLFGGLPIESPIEEGHADS